MNNRLWIILLSVLLLGCSSHFQSVNQVDSSAYLQLEGNYLGAVLIIDENIPVSLKEGNVNSFNLNGKTVAKFKISTGKHRIKIIRAQQVIVERTIYVSNSNTFEVVVP